MEMRSQVPEIPFLAILRALKDMHVHAHTHKATTLGNNVYWLLAMNPGGTWQASTHDTAMWETLPLSHWGDKGIEP